MPCHHNNLPPLVPGVKRGSWRVHDPKREQADAEYQAVRIAALERDGYTCQYCGFQARPDRKASDHTLAASGYLEVHHIDDNHANNRLDNLVSVCPFCHQVFHAGNAGHRKAARVIWCPWMTQAEINLLANLCGVAMLRAGEYAESARSLWGWLEGMESSVATMFGDTMTDPATLGTVLMGLHKTDPDLYEKRDKAIRGLRLLPRLTAFKPHLTAWKEVWLPESQWRDILELTRQAAVEA